MRFLHYVKHPGEAELISAAFAVTRETDTLLGVDELR